MKAVKLELVHYIVVGTVKTVFFTKAYVAKH